FAGRAGTGERVRPCRRGAARGLGVAPLRDRGPNRSRQHARGSLRGAGRRSGRCLGAARGTSRCRPGVALARVLRNARRVDRALAAQPHPRAGLRGRGRGGGADAGARLLRLPAERIPTIPEPVRAVVRNVVWSYGRATSALRPLPGFLIIGAQKAGTTALYAYLR